jgi:hypothetical protein
LTTLGYGEPTTTLLVLFLMAKTLLKTELESMETMLPHMALLPSTLLVIKFNGGATMAKLGSSNQSYHTVSLKPILLIKATLASELPQM